MSMYLVAELKIKYGHVEEAVGIVKEIASYMEPQGWKLLATYTPLIGHFCHLYDIWEVPDANAVPNALLTLAGDKGWEDVFTRWSKVCESEHLSVCAKLI
ncbi:hypothetical protein NX786_17990 [Telluria mixta]|jgi:hypothetical protein|uniref:NIPSNAP domain-containing protein n=1 Tax=Telluria mixta TaxID=34071 RepID=A0ABT2C1G6_9BURK|nr:hypothetical protein [Telluria mixta]MCS0631228.1 hypothetical protein [Telluria mixta]WEM95767.1 hypothetical protein P0M04_30585 [Telluria mixta]